MQNAVQTTTKENDKSVEKIVEVGHATFGLTTGSTSPKSIMGKVQIIPSLPQNFKSELSGSDEEEVSEVGSFMLDQDVDGSETVLDPSQFLLTADNLDGPDIRSVDAETQERLEALLEAAGIGKLSAADGKAFTDPQVLRNLTSSVSCALDEAAAALKRMRAEQQGQNGQDGRSLAEACSDGDIGTVRRLLDEGGSVHETTEEGETLLSLACSAGYYELAQVLLAMRANVEDRGVKGDCTPLMEAASGGFKEIVDLLIAHGADVNAQSSAGNTPLHYASCGGYEDVVRVLIKHGANVEEHNENGHTPLMEAASAGHVAVAMILLENGAGINTHSNEFKESALTLACYKGHLEMVKFLLKAGADQEHKTDEMHTALMEASMDGHVEVARLLLDSGAQVNMPADSFESPLTLAACGGHVELASLLIERDAHLEEVNDEGYTPLMEAAREGHEEMVALLLAHGADINAQTEETQETALTLACCGGFLEVSDFLIKAGANIELGCSTPLMEAAQEGHLELVKYLLKAGASVNAQTGTGDTALTYACENGHTEVAEVLLKAGADLEHESEGGRTPLMKAARAGHLATVQFLISKGACVNKQTSTNDHTVLSLASAGGHQHVVEMLLQNGANPTHRLKDGSTMLIEASKGGHTNVVNLLLNYPTSIIQPQPSVQDVNNAFLQNAANLSELPRVPIHGLNNVVPPHNPNPLPLLPPAANASMAGQTPLPSYSPNIQPMAGIPQLAGGLVDFNLGSAALPPGTLPPPPCDAPSSASSRNNNSHQQAPPSGIKAKVASKLAESGITSLTSSELLDTASAAINEYDYPPDSGSPLSFDLNDQSDLKASEKLEAFINKMMKKAELLNNTREEQMLRKQQILEELQKVERELKEKAHAQLLLNSLDQPFRPIQPELEAKMGNLQMSDQERAEVDGALSALGQPTVRPSEGPDGASDSDEKPDPCQARTAGDGHDHPQPEYTLQDSLPDQPDILDTHRLRHVPESVLHVPESALHVPEHALQVPELLDYSDDDLDDIEDDDDEDDDDEDDEDDDDEGDDEGDDEADDDDDLDEDLDDELEGIQPQIPEYGFTDQDGLMIAAPALTLHQSMSESYRNSAAQSFLCQEMAQRHLLANFPQAGNLSGQFQHVAALSQFQPILGAQLPGTTNLSASAAAALNAQYQQAAALTANSQQLITSTATSSQPSSFSTQQINFTFPQTDFVNLASTTANVLPTGAFNFQAQNINIQQLSVIGAQLGGAQPLAALPQTPLVSTQFTNTVTTSQTGLNVLPGQQNYFLQQPAPVKPALPQKGEQRPRAPCQQTSSMLSQQMVQKKKKLKQKQLLQQQQQQQQQLQNQGLHQHALPDSTSGCQLNDVTGSSQPSPAAYPVIDLDAETDSNHDTALTLACAGGHSELVQLLLTRGADMEHRDKKGFTPLILAATAGHSEVVEILLDNGADIEAQSERTKDTPLSLACSGGRYEVVELLLNRSASKEHRNVSDYTPLSLAASGGYVNIIKLLLSHGAEINSRTGSKLGISPLMLAAMNGHTAAVKLLLDMGSDINAQIETNRNTALTLACFQGRHEVVSLLVDRRANIEHRAKTGLTPLMEAASGGYVDVGRVLLDKSADVNAPPVPSSRDTALTIASDKGHYRFVELLISRGAAVDVKNKKGNSPLWLACNGGHLDVVQLLVNAGADIDSQDNRKVSCLMAAFRKGHVKVVKWMVRHVNQFPSDQECVRFIQTVTDKELLKKCQQCMDIIVSAKDRQAAEANKNASILLEELDMERSREESKKAALARKREKKKQKRKEKQEKEKEKEPQPSSKNSSPEPEKEDRPEKSNLIEDLAEINHGKRPPPSDPACHDVPSATTTSTMGTNLVNDANARNLRGSKRSASSDGKESSPAPTCESPAPENNNRGEGRKTKTKTRRRAERELEAPEVPEPQQDRVPAMSHAPPAPAPSVPSRTLRTPASRQSTAVTTSASVNKSKQQAQRQTDKSGKDVRTEPESLPSHPSAPSKSNPRDEQKTNQKSNTEKKNKLNAIDSFDAGSLVSPAKAKSKASNVSSPVRSGGKKEDGWKEVTRKIPVPRYKKVSVPSTAITRVIGRNGCNINAIREVSGAHIEVDKQKKSGDRQVTIKGSAEAIKQAHNLITAMVKDPERDLIDILPKNTKAKSLPQPMPSQSLAPIPIGVFTLPVTTAQQNGQIKVNGSPASSRNKVVVPTAPPIISAWTGPPAVQSQKKSGSSGKPTSSSSAQVPAQAKSPSAVSRQLFPSDKSQTTQAKISSSQPKATITYTAATSMTKTHVTTSVGAKIKPSYPQNVVSKPSPIFSQPPTQVKPSAASGAGPTPPPPQVQTTTGYSPFNNSFSNMSEHVLGIKKDEHHERMNFASVAAAGVAVTTAGMGTGIQSHDDPAKAPGYKPGGHQKTRSPSPEADMTKAPGYRGPNMAPLNQFSPHSGMNFPNSVDAQHQILEALAQQQFQTASGGMVLNLPGMEAEFQQFQQFRSSGAPSPHQFHDFGFRDEYSTPNQPMTLPKIESTLNPNAPNFMSRVYQQQMASPFLANFNSNLNQNVQSFMRAAQSSTPPSFTPPPAPSSGASHNYPNNFNGPEFSSNGPLGNFAGGNFQAPGVNPASRPSTFSPLPHGVAGSSSGPGRGPPSAGSNSPNHQQHASQHSADTSPLPSSSPSPTDHLKSSQEDRRHLRPIGTERAHKKSPGPPPGGYGGMGDAALWMFSADMAGAREWLNEHQQNLAAGMNGPEETLRLPGTPYMDGETPAPGLTDPNFTSVGSSMPGSQSSSQYGAYTNGSLPAGALNSLYGEAAANGAGDTTSWANNGGQGWPNWNQQP